MTRKCPWTREEDEALQSLVAQHGQRWSIISKLIPSKKSKQCRRRWNNVLNADIKMGAWSEREDKILILQHRILGNRWTEIAKAVGGRTDNAVKNRWATLSKNGGVPKRPWKKQKQDSSDSEMDNQSEPSTSGSDPEPGRPSRSPPRRTSRRSSRRAMCPPEQSHPAQQPSEEEWPLASGRGGHSASLQGGGRGGESGWWLDPDVSQGKEGLPDDETWQAQPFSASGRAPQEDLPVSTSGWGAETYPSTRQPRLTIAIPQDQDEPNTPPLCGRGFYEEMSEPSSSILVQGPWDPHSTSEALVAGLPFEHQITDGEVASFQPEDRSVDHYESDGGLDICQMLHTGVTPQSSVCKENTPPGELARFSPWASKSPWGPLLSASPSPWGLPSGNNRQTSLLQKVLSRGLDSRGSHTIGEYGHRGGSAEAAWGQPMISRGPHLSELPPVSQVGAGPTYARQASSRPSSSPAVASATLSVRHDGESVGKLPPINTAAAANGALAGGMPLESWVSQGYQSAAHVPVSSALAGAMPLESWISQGFQSAAQLPVSGGLAAVAASKGRVPRRMIGLSAADLPPFSLEEGRLEGRLSPQLGSAQARSLADTLLPSSSQALGAAVASTGWLNMQASSSVELPAASQAEVAMHRAAHTNGTQGVASSRPRSTGQAGGASAPRKRQREESPDTHRPAGTEPPLLLLDPNTQPGDAAHAANKRPRSGAPLPPIAGQAGRPVRLTSMHSKHGRNEEGLNMSLFGYAGLPRWMQGPGAAPLHMQQRVVVQEEAWMGLEPLPLWRPEIPPGWVPL